MNLINAWYSNAFWPKLLLPLSWLFRGIACIRKFYYVTRRPKLPIPVIVVGNITVGGTGKTPLVIALTKHLQGQGKKVGIVSRGYGGKGPFPLVVGPGVTAKQCGDEPLLMHLKTGATVCCDPKRLYAAQLLMDSGEIDVIISDDGLQHYALDRQIEICVVDGKRRFGNELCFPAGPLREPLSRLKTVTHIVTNGKALEGEIPMTIKPEVLVNMVSGEEQPADSFKDKSITAVCGIGNPVRFFETLKDLGCVVTEKPFPDHYAYQASDFDGIKGDIIMTEKDAIKCTDFVTKNMWVLAVEAELDVALLLV